MFKAEKQGGVWRAWHEFDPFHVFLDRDKRLALEKARQYRKEAIRAEDQYFRERFRAIDKSYAHFDTKS